MTLGNEENIKTLLKDILVLKNAPLVIAGSRRRSDCSSSMFVCSGHHFDNRQIWPIILILLLSFNVFSSNCALAMKSKEVSTTESGTDGKMVNVSMRKLFWTDVTNFTPLKPYSTLRPSLQPVPRKRDVSNLHTNSLDLFDVSNFLRKCQSFPPGGALPFCSMFNVISSINPKCLTASNLSEWSQNNATWCDECVTSVVELDKEAERRFDQFRSIISHFDCEATYAFTTSCKQCLVGADHPC